MIKVVVDANQTIKGDPSVSSAKERVDTLLKKLIFHDDQFSPVIDMLGSKAVDDMTDSERLTLFKTILGTIIA